MSSHRREQSRCRMMVRALMLGAGIGLLSDAPVLAQKKAWPSPKYVALEGAASSCTVKGEGWKRGFSMTLQVGGKEIRILDPGSLRYMAFWHGRHYHDVAVKWETKPQVKVFGREEDPTTVVAYRIWVKTDGGYQSWFTGVRLRAADAEALNPEVLRQYVGEPVVAWAWLNEKEAKKFLKPADYERLRGKYGEDYLLFIGKVAEDKASPLGYSLADLSVRGTEYVEMVGQLRDFQELTELTAHFRFTIRPVSGRHIEPGTEYTICGRNRTRVRNLKLSPTFTGLKVDWSKNPWVRLVGRIVADDIFKPRLKDVNELDLNRLVVCWFLWVLPDKDAKEGKLYYHNNWFHGSEDEICYVPFARLFVDKPLRVATKIGRTSCRSARMFPRAIYEAYAKNPFKYLASDKARLVSSNDNALGYSVLPE